MQSPLSGPVRACPRRMSRLVRWLAGRNTLRRPVDRIEGVVLVALTAAFLVAMAVASVLGVHTYQSQRVATAGLRPVVAVLSQAGPLSYGSMAQLGQAEARWRDPGGSEQSGPAARPQSPPPGRGRPGTGLAESLGSAGRASRRPGRHDR